jgi:hypothetical protein
MTFRYRHGDRPLEGYTIRRGVGRGGFGEVYYAVSDGGREVALKAIFVNHDVELRGVRHCINLKSPHLVSIFDVRTNAEGLPFVIMEYVSGLSLRDLLREHPNGLGEEKSAYLFREIAKGLAYLHEHGIVHRDLKPENIFYEDGYVKIGDYGLSKYISVSRQSGQTMSVGTVHYMAPEIGSGIYSRGIDIYALGVILHELLTGKVPFTGDSFGEILMKHLTVEPDLEAIPEPFRSTIRRALAKKPEERFATVEEMARELFVSKSLETRMSVFNPQSLSVAGRRSKDVAGGTPVGDGPKIAAGPLPDLALAREAGGIGIADPLPAESAEPRGRPAAATVPPLGDGGAREERARPEPARNLVDSVPGFDDPALASTLDPLDATQRKARALFAVGVTAVLGSVIGSGLDKGLGLAFSALAGAVAVLVTETFLAERFRIGKGFPRRLVAATVGFVPMFVGAIAQDPRAGARSSIALLIGMVLVDWRERLRPTRDERISIGHAISAGIAGFFSAAIVGRSPFLPGLTLAAASVLLNAWSAFVPVPLRRSTRIHPKGPDPMPAPAPSMPAAPQHYAPAVSPARAHPRAASPIPLAAHGAAAAGPLRDFGPVPMAGPASRAWRRPADVDPRDDVARADAVDREGSTPSRDRVDADLPASQGARIAWSLVGALTLATGLSIFAASFEVLGNRVRPDDALMMSFVGPAVAAFSGFAFYRGLRARRRGFWTRTVRPFLMTAGLAVAFGSGVSLLRVEASPSTVVHIRDRYSSEPLAFAFAVSLAWGIFFLAQTLWQGSDADRSGATANGGARTRPGIVRSFFLFLGFLGVTASVSLAIASATETGSPHLSFDERCAAIASFGGGAFFLLCSLRARRGTWWSGWLRPLLLTGAPTAFVLAAYYVSERPRIAGASLHADEVLAGMVTMIFSLVLGVFALLVRGEAPEFAEFRKSDGTADTRPRAASRGVSPFWSTVGWVGWIIGVPLLIAGGFLEQRLGEFVGFGPRTGFEEFLVIGGLGACLLGSLAAVIARIGSGRIHMIRILLAQTAFLAVLSLFVFSLAGVDVPRPGELLIEHTTSTRLAPVLMLIGLGIGATFACWPAASKNRTAKGGEAA